jgi:hypothetical protein
MKILDFCFFIYFSLFNASVFVAYISEDTTFQGLPGLVEGVAPALCLSSLFAISAQDPYNIDLWNSYKGCKQSILP